MTMPTLDEWKDVVWKEIEKTHAVIMTEKPFRWDLLREQTDNTEVFASILRIEKGQDND